MMLPVIIDQVFDLSFVAFAVAFGNGYRDVDSSSGA